MAWPGILFDLGLFYPQTFADRPWGHGAKGDTKAPEAAMSLNYSIFNWAVPEQHTATAFQNAKKRLSHFCKECIL